MRKILYIGEHPAHFGGITRKSALLLTQLKKYHEIKEISIDVKDHKKTSFAIAMIRMLIMANRYDGIIYCLDNPRTNLLLRFQELFHKKTMETTVVVVSGGDFSQFFDARRNTVTKRLKKSKQLWVEIRSIIEKLNNNGFDNVVYYPNPRIIEVSKPPLIFAQDNELKLLYYSQISREKGLYDTIEVVKKLNENKNIRFSIDYYGLIKEEVKADFDSFIESTPNARYKGFNDEKDLNDYYNVLNQYDIMLFPTNWYGEGIAGACVEAKISGVAIIASKHNWNSEIVDESMGEGYIADKGNIKQMVEIITKLYNDPETLNRIKEKSYESMKRFNVSEYQELYMKCFD